MVSGGRAVEAEAGPGPGPAGGDEGLERALQPAGGGGGEGVAFEGSGRQGCRGGG
jgi:hypothetical protein